MSEEGGESRGVGAFLLGFLTGVLVCVGIGGGFFLVVGRRATMAEMRADMARAEAEMARHEAEAQLARAEAERRAAQENERKARDASKKSDENARKAKKTEENFADGDLLPKPKELVEEKKEPQSPKEKGK